MSHFTEKKAALLTSTVKHIDLRSLVVTEDTISALENTAFQARNLARAARIYHKMLEDKTCSIILCLAGSLVSAGMKKIILDLIEHNMVDAVVSTGANLVDQDFFEALGFQHYQGTPTANDVELQNLGIDRIYDTYIDEDQLRICDETICQIANTLEAKPYSSREFLIHMGAYLEKHHPEAESIVLTAYRKKVPLFVPAFSDCSAGFGLVMHQVKHPYHHISIDSVKDFRELTQLKIEAKETGLLMLGGGVPKNFAQDIVVAAELLGHEASLHQYAIQITVADERDGALSGSTLKEACSWGKVSVVHEQMVYAEATLAFPTLAAYAYHSGVWKTREGKAYNQFLDRAV